MAWHPPVLSPRLAWMIVVMIAPAVASCVLPGQVDCGVAGSTTGNPLGATTEFVVDGGGYLKGITKGPDGNLWFANGNQIGRITPAGTLTQFPYTPDSPWAPYAGASAITTGPDGNLWITDVSYDDVARITPSGVVTFFPLDVQDEWTEAITAGPDGNLWFAATTLAHGTVAEPTARIGRITPTGKLLNEVRVPGGDTIYSITTGPDGALWFTDEGGNAVGRVTVDGQLTEFALPHRGSFPNAITTGPDGNLWFTETDGNRIGRITPGGQITEYTAPSPILRREYGAACGQEGPFGITAGPDGALWFTERSNNKLGRITVAGEFTEFALPTAHSDPNAITIGPDGALWFTEVSAGKIGRLSL
jgi:virginiamycin B lyase